MKLALREVGDATADFGGCFTQFCPPEWRAFKSEWLKCKRFPVEGSP